MLRHALPQGLALTLFVIVIKAGAETTALTAQFDDHQFHEVFGAAWLIRVAQFLLGRLHHVIAKLQRGFVQQRQRANWHAKRLGGIFDERRFYALGHQLHRLTHIRREYAVGEEAANVLYNDRRLLDLCVIIKRRGHSPLARVFTRNDLQQRHFFNRREEVQPDKQFRT